MRLVTHALVLLLGLLLGWASRPAPRPQPAARCAQFPPQAATLAPLVAALRESVVQPVASSSAAPLAASPPSPAPEPEDPLDALRASPLSHDPWTYAAHQQLDEIERRLAARGRLGARRCAAAGCVVEVRYEAAEASALMQEAVADAERGWRGGLLIGALREAPGGGLIQALILLPPPAP